MYFFFLQQMTPLRNNAVIIMKAIAMTTAYPSSCWMVKGEGRGGRGGGAEHASIQSRHEQPGSPFYTKQTVSTYIKRF